MEEAELISVERRVGQFPWVSINPKDSKDSVSKARDILRLVPVQEVLCLIKLIESFDRGITV